MHRRGFLALAGTGAVCGPLVAVAGCLSQPNLETTTQTTTTQTASEPHAPEPTAALPTITTYPFRFDRSVTLPTGGMYGWFFDGSFTKAVNLAGSVTDGVPVSIYITEDNLQDAQIPDSNVETRANTASFDLESVEVTDGHGTILISTSGSTTVQLRVDVTTI